MGGLLGGEASDLVENSEEALDAIREGFPCAYFVWHWDKKKLAFVAAQILYLLCQNFFQRVGGWRLQFTLKNDCIRHLSY